MVQCGEVAAVGNTALVCMTQICQLDGGCLKWRKHSEWWKRGKPFCEALPLQL